MKAKLTLFASTKDVKTGVLYRTKYLYYKAPTEWPGTPFASYDWTCNVLGE